MILLLALACALEPAPQPEPPEVVVIVLDSLRADLGGAPRPEWMTGGREYVNAYSAAPYTTASTATLLTGRYPLPGEMGTPDAGTARLQGPSWATTILTDQPVVAGLVGSHVAHWGSPGSSELVAESVQAIRAGTVGAALYDHMHGAHSPYDAVRVGGKLTVTGREYDRQLRAGALAPDMAAWTRLQYRSAAEHALDGAAIVVASARQAGAVVMLTADHGEALGEGDRWGHGRSLDDEQIRVPLYVWGPGVTPGTDPAAVPATCVGQTARLVLGEAVPDACDLRDGTIRGDVVSGMLLADGTWDERIISAQATP